MFLSSRTPTTTHLFGTAHCMLQAQHIGGRTEHAERANESTPTRSGNYRKPSRISGADNSPSHLSKKMVQGKTKGLQVKASSSRRAAKAISAPKKGKKYIAPKKASLVKQAATHKVTRISALRYKISL